LRYDDLDAGFTDGILNDLIFFVGIREMAIYLVDLVVRSFLVTENFRRKILICFVVTVVVGSKGVSIDVPVRRTGIVWLGTARRSQHGQASSRV
jgi:hypothetical protein